MDSHENRTLCWYLLVPGAAGLSYERGPAPLFAKVDAMRSVLSGTPAGVPPLLMYPLMEKYQICRAPPSSMSLSSARFFRLYAHEAVKSPSHRP